MEDLLDKVYPGKVLLFGEYTVIHGGDTLAIPYYDRYASWDYDDLEFESREIIDKFIDFIVLQGMCDFDLDRFSAEWEQGLFLESSIPTGYGAGSSGSVVAAIYDSFVNKPVLDFVGLREVFQKMEAYFHGSSSGIDPLVSYLGKAVLLKDDELNVLDVDENILLDKLYLFDSGESRRTAPLVKSYKEKLRSISYKKLIDSVLLPLNTELIQAFLNENIQEFTSSFEQVSTFQWKHFNQMFPSRVNKKLKDLQKKYNALSKICGAGGGGYYLVYCENPEIIHDSDIISLN